MINKNDGFYQDKYFVAKNSDINDLLNQIKRECSDDFFRHVLAFLGDLEKVNTNEYLVVNQDEPYAEEIYNIIKQNERKQIIAFVGRAGSGKDYQCNLLKEKGFTKMAFADALRDIAFSSFDIPYAFGMERYEEMKANEDCIKVVTEDSAHKVSFRKFLELLGTQGIRKYDNDFWCRALIKTLKDKQYKKVCISDMRFINEYTYLKKFAEENDYVFKVLFCNYRSDRYQDNNTHESARLANYFCTHGYIDLQEITDDDMQQAFEKFTKVLV